MITTTVKAVRCPACYANIEVSEKLQLSEAVRCPKCKRMLEVINQRPLMLGKMK